MGVAVLAAGPSVSAASAPRPVTTRSARAAPQPSEADKALIRKLLRGATGRSEAPAMERVLDGMRGSRIKLSVGFDPGGETQKIQRRILRDLDEAITEAWQSQRLMPTTARSDSDARRRRRRSEKPTSAQEGANRPGSNQPMPDERATRGEPTSAAVRPRGMMRELRRGWGRLPSRDRDEVVQGIGQDFLTKYGEWIERYYRALANPERE